MSLPGRLLKSWSSVAVGVGLIVGVLDAYLLQRKFGYFTGGFLADGVLTSQVQVWMFAVSAFASDVAVAGVLAAVPLWALRRSGLHPNAQMAVAAATAALPFIVFDFVSYQILAFVGTADFGLMLNLGQGRLREVLAVAAPHLGRPAAWVAGGVVGFGAVVWFLHKRADRLASAVAVPRVRTLIALCVAALIVQGAGQVIDENVAWGFRWKASGKLATGVFAYALDFDGDGYTVLSRPPDQAPYDANRHPYALEEAGNGIDENGLAGDLPAAFPRFAEQNPSAPAFATTPDVVLVLLEGVRADAIGQTLDGKAVTPVIDGLGRRGVKVPVAVAHVASTSPSRHSLMTGSLLAEQETSSLVDDFLANGYQVVYVSGQDESFGTPRFDVGFDRATAHWDARDNVGARYSTFATPGSLAVPAAEVLSTVVRLLEERRADTRPLFLYVNFHDTHFPYHHAGVRPLVSPVVVERADISRAKAEPLRAMYLNTVSNVDAAIGGVLDAVRRTRGGDPAVVVTSDHGEALFETGALGHGLTIERSQNQVPFVATGLGVELPELMGLSEFRVALHRALASPAATQTPRLRPAAPGGVFVYTGALTRPTEVGAFGLRDLYVLNTRARALRVDGGPWRALSELPPEESRRVDALAWRWESIAVARAARGAAQ